MTHNNINYNLHLADFPDFFQCVPVLGASLSCLAYVSPKQILIVTSSIKHIRVPGNSRLHSGLIIACNKNKLGNCVVMANLGSQLETWERGTSVEELPLLDWPVGMSVGIFLITN